MPEKIKKVVGETSWSTIFMGLAMALVVVMQQYQTMRIAEIKTLAEVNKINFMEKQEVEDIAHSLEDKVHYLEQNVLDKQVIMSGLNNLEDRIVVLEHELNIKANDGNK